MNLTTKLRVGVIGAGRIGKLHADNLARRIPNVEVAGIADIYLPAAQELAANLRVPVAVSDYHALLADPAIDAVLICSATDTHSSIIVEAAKAGKHIFCEKPIDFDLARIDRALEAVTNAGVKFQIGFNRRFDANFRKVRELVATGKVGSPHLLRITSRDPAPPPIDYLKNSGGIFLDMTIHDFDMARYLMGSEVTELYASGSVLVDPQIGEAGDIDTAVTLLRFASGALGTIDNSRRAAYGYDQRVEVFGSAGAVAVSNKTPDSAVLSDVNGVHGPLPLYFFLERYNESFITELREFAQAISGDSNTPVTGLDARIPVVMGLAAKKSLLENRPVKLSEIG